MKPSKACSARLPPSAACSGGTRLASQGMMVSDTNSEPSTVKITATGIERMYIRSMPVAVIFTVLGSLFVSLTIIPWLASRVPPEHAAEGGNRALHAFEGFIHRTYAPVLDAALRRPATALAAAGLFVAGAAALVAAGGFSLFPKAQTAP